MVPLISQRNEQLRIPRAPRLFLDHKDFKIEAKEYAFSASQNAQGSSSPGIKNVRRARVFEA